jgi:tRNA threonylcarbamoyladenosine biosynthesis protein TsaB
MFLLLDTSTPICKLTLVSGDNEFHYEWEANRELADGLLSFLQKKLVEHQKTWRDITGIGIMKGPGSFTGLRIGMAVCNTLAAQLSIPIVGEMYTDEWKTRVTERLKTGENEKIVLPFYDRGANITKPRK